MHLKCDTAVSAVLEIHVGLFHLHLFVVLKQTMEGFSLLQYFFYSSLTACIPSPPLPSSILSPE